MKTSKKKQPQATVERPYHHGDLRASLIEAGEVVLRRDGVAGLGMRAVTREAGVSHTAAKPHFGSLDGLRAEVAAAGYHRLAESLERAASVREPRQRRIALARAYLHFAHKNTALFELMFRHELVDMKQPALIAATARAVLALAGPLASQPGLDHIDRSTAIRMSASWAFVHGLAVLVSERRLTGILKRTPEFSALLELAEATIDSTSLQITE